MDVIAEKVEAMIDADDKDEHLVRRRIKVNKELWKRFGDEADRLNLTEGQFLELLFNTSGTTHKDKIIASQKEALESMRKTVEYYRVFMQKAGIDLSNF